MDLFTTLPHSSIAALGESGLIESIRRWLGPSGRPSPQGIGDDCAILPASKHRQVITVDPVILGRHFTRDADPSKVGAKLFKRNVSDIAAMGARPQFALVALAIDPRLKIQWLESFYRALAAEAKKYGVKIVGGDVAEQKKTFVATLTMLGAASGKRILTRKGAKIGDSIYVTGTLGGSILGKHLTFSPRLQEGIWLATRPDIRSMMDLSDGLAKDLAALMPAKARAALRPRQIPLSSAAKTLASKSRLSPLEHALCDGEDYELVFSLDRKSDRGAFEAQWKTRFSTRLSYVGEFVSDKSVYRDEINLSNLRGYEHLR